MLLSIRSVLLKEVVSIPVLVRKSLTAGKRWISTHIIMIYIYIYIIYKNENTWNLSVFFDIILFVFYDTMQPIKILGTWSEMKVIHKLVCNRYIVLL